MLTRAQQLHDRAQRCRHLAESAMPDAGRSILFEIARRYEREAAEAEPARRPADLAEAAA